MLDMICLNGSTAIGYRVGSRVCLGIAAADGSFWTIVAQGSLPSVQLPFLTLSATGLADLLVHALERASAKLARRNTEIGLSSAGASPLQYTIRSTVSG